eukprot:UN00821
MGCIGSVPGMPSAPEIELDMEAVGEAITDAVKGIPESIENNKREFPGEIASSADYEWPVPDTTMTLNKKSTQDEITQAAIVSACGNAVKDAIKDSIWGQFEPQIDEQLGSVEPALPAVMVAKAKDKFKEQTIDALVDAAVDKCLEEARKE